MPVTACTRQIFEPFDTMNIDHAPPPGRLSHFLIDSVEVWPERNQLKTDHQSVSLEPRIMAVLCVLAAQPEQVITREELLSQLWHSEAADDSVTRAISLLRKAFTELGVERELIETIPKRGYALAGPIVPLGSALHVDEPVAVVKDKPRIFPGLAAAGILVLTALVLFVAADREPSVENSATPSLSVAVLPFTSISAEPSDQLFADGLSEELLNALASVPGLTVSARSSSFAYKNRSQSVESVGEALGVAHVLEGSLRRANQRVRITAQLSSAKSGYGLWSESYDRSMEDIFAVQEDIARQVAKALSDHLVPAEDSRLFDAGTQRAGAFENYVKGRDYLNRRGLSLARAIARFEDAIAEDPDYARAYSGLAAAHAVSHIYMDVPKLLARERARNFAHIALKHDPQLAEPYAVLGVIEANQNNWSGAIANYAQAEQRDPNDVTMLQWYAEALSYVGYIEQAYQKIQRALEINSKSAVLHLIAGNIAFSRGDIEGTEKHYRLSEEHGLGDGVNGSSFYELAVGNYERAARMMALEQFNAQRISAANVASLEDFLLGLMRREHDVDSKIGVFPTLAEDDDFLVPAYMIAGESEKALRLLESDPDGDHDSYYLLWSPIDSNLRRAPYFTNFVTNTGLLTFWQDQGWPEGCHRDATGATEQIVCR